MKKLIQLLLIWCLIGVANAQELTLVKGGKSSYQIVMPEKPTLIEIQSANVLQDYLFRISGAQLPVVADNGPSSKHEIWIGRVKRAGQDLIDYDKLGQDGLLIKTDHRTLILTGGDKKGVIYSVYTFLDKYLGCRKFSAEVTYVPRKKTIKLNAIHDQQLPAFSYRETYYNEAWSPEYMDWHKLNSHQGRNGEKSEWGYWVHTFLSLLDPKEYGEAHPEYFSYYDGKRHSGIVPSWDGASYQPEAQLCLTNPEVLEIVCANLKKAIEKNPDALYWSVSQNDNVNYCRCDSCAALDIRYAAFSPEEKKLATHSGQYAALGMGSLLSFVNKVAERFPEKIISTLAYQYTRTPPKDIVPRKNVNIMLCNIESTRNEPVTTGDKSFSEDLIGWGKLTNNIIVWDYVIRFSNLLAPFPNLRVLQPNLQFLHQNRVSAMFEQGNRDRGGEFAALRAYLISRLLWNTEIDLQKEMDEFLNGYYGKAASDIKQYIELLHDYNQAGEEIKMSIFGSPDREKESFLSESLITQYNEIFDRALKKVKKNPEVYERVKSARLPVYYAVLEIAKAAKTGERGAFITEGNQVKPNPAIVNLLYEFVYHCNRTGVSRITEWHTTPKEYLEKYLRFLSGE